MLLVVFLSVPLAQAALAAASAKPGAVAVELVSEVAAFVPGKPFWVGLRMRHDPHWHTYWRNPGDAGVPTTLAWRLAPGFRAGDIEWPFPERMQQGPLASYGYQGEVLLPVMIFPPRTSVRESTLAVDAAWLECKESCIPREARLALKLPAGASAAPGPNAPAFARARERRVQAAEGLSAVAAIRGEAIEVALTLPRGWPRRGELFLEDEDIVEPGVVPALREADGALLWSTRLTPNGRRQGGRSLAAVWVSTADDGRRRGYRVDIRPR